MNEIDLSGPLTGEILMPGDKSMTHRAIMLASLADGTSRISKPLLGEDCMRTLEIFRTLGVDFDVTDDEIKVCSKGYKHFTTPHQTLYTGNSGTTTRIVAGLLCGLGIESVLSGDASIGRRPMNRIMDPLNAMGANISGIDDNYTPLIIKPTQVNGMTHHMTVASAQVKSAIMFASLFADAPTTIIEKEQTRNHSETMFNHYHIPSTVDDQGRIQIPERAIQHVKPVDFDVPGDISSAAFFIVAALITPGSDVTLHHIGVNQTRSGILDVVKDMGGDITLFNVTDAPEPTASIRIRYTPDLKPIEISGTLIPRLIDEIPIIALLCTQAHGESVIKDAAELKVKETNRIDTTVNELNALGFDLTPTDDGMRIAPSTYRHHANVSSHGDHRIGMTLAVASLLSSQSIIIDAFESVNISFPGFLTKMNQLQKEG